MEEERKQFTVKDDRAAEWCLKKIAEAKEELDRMTYWYQQQMSDCQAHYLSEVVYFKGLLRNYFETVPARETKTKRKYALPSGELVINKAKQDFGCENPETLLNWCEANDPDLVRVKREPAWADIKKRLVQTDAGIIDGLTGLKVDGVVILDKPEEFDVTLKGVK